MNDRDIDMKEKIMVSDREFEVMIPAERIEEAVEAVAQKINADYSAEDQVVVLGMLNGAFIFMGDLVRKFNFDVEMSFVKLSSYQGCSSTGSVRELIGLNGSLAGRNVLVVEDIVDTGVSITHLAEILRREGVKSARYCTLFLKPEAYRATMPIDYVAMEIGNEFIVGYGLDYNEWGRGLKDIYVTKDE